MFNKTDQGREAGTIMEESIHQVKDACHRLTDAQHLDPLLERIGDARVVMLGEASHGTHEFYTWRARISQRLIQEKGFNFIAVEGDWPDCYGVNRYVKQHASNEYATGVLKQFSRWPTWMWANWEIAALAEWLKAYNQPLPREKKAGFYGLDVYSLWESIAAIMQYVEKTDPVALAAVQEALTCFEPYKNDEYHYAKSVRFVSETCEPEMLRLLTVIRQNVPRYDDDPEQAFNMEQNAWVAANAEKYYRTMLQGDAHSWNVRDSHMQETLEHLLAFHGADSKAIVWAHNTHIGDASTTEMAGVGMHNIGQLCRSKYSTVLVGFGTFKGSVIAGSYWGDEMKKMKVPAGKQGSWEYIMHHAAKSNSLLIMHELAAGALAAPVGHRAIGVVYRPEYERAANYVNSVLPRRYDAFLFINETTALHPLHIVPDKLEVSETYPFGI